MAVIGLCVGHGFSFGLLAFEVCTVDHHSEDAIFEGENNGLGESCGERASATVNSQSGGRPMDNHSVLVVEHKNCHCGGGWFGHFELHGFSFGGWFIRNGRSGRSLSHCHDAEPSQYELAQRERFERLHVLAPCLQSRLALLFCYRVFHASLSILCSGLQCSASKCCALHYISIIESCHVSKNPLKSTLGDFPM